MLTFSGKIETNVGEEIVFEGFKKFMLENFQEYEFEVSGKDKTLREGNK